MPELAVVLVLILIAWPFCRIFRRAGFSAWLGLLCVIPLVNIVAVCYLAFAEWPVAAELRALKEPTEKGLGA
jgi:hypothetical protein